MIPLAAGLTFAALTSRQGSRYLIGLRIALPALF
jgi:hypothetical protein